jgi:Mg2+-importing ATPase
MVVVSVVMRFLQEYRSSKAADTLRRMVLTTATVSRDGQRCEVPFQDLVPGDIVHLSAGDMVPADVRLLSAKDVFVSQAALTGESLPVEKLEPEPGGSAAVTNALARPNLCFMGTNLVSGTATALVILTGARTQFGSLAKSVVNQRALTSFDKGVNRVTWVLIRFMLVMVPVVFLLNGFVKGDFKESFLFAIAVAVGLTPEMLPMVVTANLARGAVAMSRHKVIVKRLNAIQNLGAMDVLCTDKTGTLTQDKVVLEKHLNLTGSSDLRVLELAYLNSYYQTGLKNLLDRAVFEHVELAHEFDVLQHHTKVDEIPFDFTRRRMSVVVANGDARHVLICKGAVEEMLTVCTGAELGADVVALSSERQQDALALVRGLNEEGFRVVAVASKTLPPQAVTYSVSDERDLVLAGFMAFLDPPKASAWQAIAALQGHGVRVVVLTGDNDVVTRRVCREVGLPIDRVVLGHEVDDASDTELADVAEMTAVFAKLNPAQKARIVRALQGRGHTVGYLGDGINDAPALRDADVGISVDTATDIARESADIILLEKSLLVLEDGVLRGREVYGNIVKYIKMTASSNFGNVFSVLIASAVLPFLPMLPVQLLIQNLLYDCSQLSLR